MIQIRGKCKKKNFKVKNLSELLYEFESYG